MFTFPSTLIKTKNHFAVGTIWHTEGSRGIYNTEMTDKGFTCDCPSYRKCKHIKAVEQNLFESN